MLPQVQAPALQFLTGTRGRGVILGRGWLAEGFATVPGPRVGGRLAGSSGLPSVCSGEQVVGLPGSRSDEPRPQQA